MEALNKLKEDLRFSKNIAICSHRNPDGDALGASLALKHFLSNMGHNVKVVVPSEHPAAFEFLPGIEDVAIYDVHHEDVDPFLEKCDFFFALDFNALDRIDRLGEKIGALDKPVHMIDHHLEPEPFYTYGLSDTGASSTCELIYEFIQILGKEEQITKDVALCILTGIITDTGSFKYSTRPNTFMVAAKMQALGVDVKWLQDAIFNSMTEKQLKLLGHALNKRMEILPEYRTGIIALNKYDYANFNIQRGDTEGIVNYLLKVKDIDLAAFITQQPQIIKISMRSKGDLSVQEIARNHFNGGGHKNAAGGAQYGSLTKVIDKFKKIIPDYITKQIVNE